MKSGIYDAEYELGYRQAGNQPVFFDMNFAGRSTGMIVMVVISPFRSLPPAIPQCCVSIVRG
ncbi:hypothetical protein [Paenibacillus hamazuiensis]|uniref:hypothetical protein n=1 Tax=Paenibacillus hamazuiensis TaxID=2936508 RepID=UPI00200E0068|nr:hypothetical protein [Paenibacillus hamazuiensis]